MLGTHPLPNSNETSVKCHSITALFLSLHTTISVDESASVLQLYVRLLTLQLQAPPCTALSNPLIGQPGIGGAAKALHYCCIVSLEARASDSYTDTLTHTLGIIAWEIKTFFFPQLCTHYPCSTGNINGHGRCISHTIHFPIAMFISFHSFPLRVIVTPG